MADGILKEGTTFFDYGCGRGGDVRSLQELGYDAAGWDPHFSPRVPRKPAEVVNLGYVVNVVESPEERERCLVEAWRLTRDVLVVAARIASEGSAKEIEPYSDGHLTRRGTFQRLFEHSELRSWIEATLTESAIAAGPGVYYIFRNDERRESFLASRFRPSIRRPRITWTASVFEEHKIHFEQLADFLCQRGRPPDPRELPAIAALEQGVGSLRKALLVLRRLTDVEQWKVVEAQRSRDLLVYLALGTFRGRRKFSSLPLDLQLDVRSFFGNYRAACEKADQLLFSVGDLKRLRVIAEASPVGKVTPSALYAHISALPSLPPELRVYEGCARVIVGSVDGANMIKLNLEEPRVSYLAYPRFDKDGHPALAAGLVVDILGFRLRYKDYSQVENPPILHRKELFVPEDYPRRPLFAALTQQEERAGLYAATVPIGRKDHWEQVVASRGLAIRGHRLVRCA